MPDTPAAGVVEQLIAATLASRDAFREAAQTAPEAIAAICQERAADQQHVASILQSPSGLPPLCTSAVDGERISVPVRPGRNGGTSALLLAILESRRAYMLAMSLARDVLLEQARTHETTKSNTAWQFAQVQSDLCAEPSPVGAWKRRHRGVRLALLSGLRLVRPIELITRHR